MNFAFTAVNDFRIETKGYHVKLTKADVDSIVAVVEDSLPVIDGLKFPLAVGVAKRSRVPTAPNGL